MKQIFTLLFTCFLCISFSVFSQNDTRRNNSSIFNKGNKIAGIELGIAGDFNTITQLDISKNNKDYGLLILPSYGWFVENNWVIGGQAILGFSNNSYKSGNGIQYSEYKSSYTDVGVAPFTRYFIPLGKRNVVSIFGHAAMPVMYSTSEWESKYGNPINTTSNSNYEVRLFGIIGLGVSLNGRFGSLEVNANNTGLYLGFQKYIGKK